MPAMNPGNTAAIGNPSSGMPVIMSPFSGPKGSPFDRDSAGNASTGAMNTGIGFGLNNEVPGMKAIVPQYMDNYTPGITMPAGTVAPDARLLAIGGGRSSITVTSGDVAGGTSLPNPYVAQPVLAFGGGGSRDGGAGPSFTGFSMKLVTATADVFNGAAIEAGYVNRSNVTLPAGRHQFGSNQTVSPAIT